MGSMTNTGSQPMRPDLRLTGWRRLAAKRICGLLNCGVNGLASVGINAEDAVMDVLLEHKCIHDPVDESAYYRDNSEADQ